MCTTCNFITKVYSVKGSLEGLYHVKFPKIKGILAWCDNELTQLAENSLSYRYWH